HEGSKHDKRIFEDSLLKEINNIKHFRVNLFVDKGYEGIEKLIFAGSVKVYIPKKERKKLSEIEKERNKYINQERVKIEHIFGKIKRSRILLERYMGKDRKVKYKNLLDIYKVKIGLLNYAKGANWRVI
ncbi:MAG: transposase family protein, partial [Nautiliaceae bacterium]